MISAILSLFKGEKKFESINAVEAKELIKNTPDLQILDVRTQNEISGGMIKNAIHNDLFKGGFVQRLESLSKDKPVLVYCRSGNRSRSACGILNKNNFETLYNLNGGYTQWK